MAFIVLKIKMNEKKSLHPSQKGLRSTLLGIVVSLFLAVIKGVAGYFGNSYALVADAIESLSDIFSSIILWFGLKVASKPPDEDHPYGHGKAEPLAAIFVGLALVIAAIVITKESIRHLLTPHEVPEAYTLVVLVLVIFVKEYMFRHVFKVGTEVESQAVKADAFHHRSDAITSAAAFVGISVALIGGEGYEWADDVAALIAAGIIVLNAVHIIRPAFEEIMDRAPSSGIIEKVRKIAAGVEGVEGLDKCFVRKMGFEYYVDLHVVVKGNLSVREGHRIAHQVKDEILKEIPRINDVLVHIEPD